MNTMDLDDLEPSTFGFNSSAGATSAAGDDDTFGMDMLMNNRSGGGGGGGGGGKKRSAGFSLSDIDMLDNELGAGPPPMKKPATENGGGGSSSIFGDFFSFGSSNNNKSSTSSSSSADELNIGKSTIQLDTTAVPLQSSTAAGDGGGGGSSSWGNMFRASSIPRKLSASSTADTIPTSLSEREKRREVIDMIRQMDDMVKHKIIEAYDPDITKSSPYEDVKDEFHWCLNEKRRKDSIKLQKWWFTTLASTVEFGNASLNPFGFNLDGLSDQITEEIDSYNDIFSKLYDKYKGAELSPEVYLALRFALTVSTVNLTNKALASAPPQFGDVIRSNPGLYKQFTAAAGDMMTSQFTGGSGSGGGGGGHAFANELRSVPQQHQQQPPRMMFTDRINREPPQEPSRPEMRGPRKGILEELQQSRMNMNQPSSAPFPPPPQPAPSVTKISAATMQFPPMIPSTAPTAAAAATPSSPPTMMVPDHLEQSASSLTELSSGVILSSLKRKNNNGRKSDKNLVSMNLDI